jgi:hypothetical protein
MSAQLSIDLARIIALYHPEFLLRFNDGSSSKIQWEKNTKIVFEHNIEKKTIKCKDEKMWKQLYGYLSDNIIIRYGREYYIVLKNGKLYGRGNNKHGQLGLGDHTPRKEIEEIKNVPKNIIDVKCGNSHTIIIDSGGNLYGCGNNESGQLGLGDWTSRNTFSKITDIPRQTVNSNVSVEVVCDAAHTFMIYDGKLYGCGNNFCGQLGLGDTTNKNKFIKIDNIDNVVAVDGKSNYTIVRDRFGNLYGCGSNHYGQLGSGDRIAKHKFERIWNINGISIASAADIYCWYSYVIVRMTNKDLYHCGSEFSATTIYKFRKMKINIKDIVDIIICCNYLIIRDIRGKLYSNRCLALDGDGYTVFHEIIHSYKFHIINISPSPEGNLLIKDIDNKIYQSYLTGILHTGILKLDHAYQLDVDQN